MKSYIAFATVVAGVLAGSAYASNPDPDRALQGTGILRCEQYSHSVGHGCALEFEDAASNKTYSVVDSPDLEKRYCPGDRDLKVTVSGELTPRFLFWGGNLKVSSFSVVEELNAMPRSANISARPKVRAHGGPSK